jgi:hypothetical protein
MYSTYVGKTEVSEILYCMCIMHSREIRRVTNLNSLPYIVAGRQAVGQRSPTRRRDTRTQGPMALEMGGSGMEYYSKIVYRLVLTYLAYVYSSFIFSSTYLTPHGEQ